MKGRKLVNARSRADAHGAARWVYGVNAVWRRLTVRPNTVREVRMHGAASSRLRDLGDAAARGRIPLHEVDDAELRQLTGSRDHQGVAALTDPFSYADLGAIVDAGTEPLLVVDQIQDPHNLGALIRTAAATGMAAVILPRDGAVGVTPTVEKAAAGAAIDVPICRVTNITQVLRRLRERGVWSLALVPRGGESLLTVEIPWPIALVVGGEAGLRPLVERSCDVRASIPVREPVESLNSSVAGALGMYEILRRRSRA